MFENKKIMKENEKLKEEIIKYKTVKKHQEQNNILNEVQNLKNELSQMERYLIPRINDTNSKIQYLKKNKQDLEGNLKQSFKLGKEN